MSIASLTPRVREALGVSSSYDAATIPAAIKRAAQRLLRDYNFPKARARQTTVLALGQNSWALPSGVGKIRGLRYYNPTDTTYSDWLERREGFVLPVESDSLSAHQWWIEGATLYLSNKVDSGSVAQGLQAILFYQTLDPDASGGWIYDDFEDVLYYMTVYREASTMRKPEVQQAFTTLYQEELSALAIYLNELEWDGVVVNQREERIRFTERYPA